MTRALILCLLLSGCTTVPTGTDECGYAWQLELEAIPRDRYEIVETDDVFLRCGFEEKAQACSIRYKGDDGKPRGIVYIPRDIPQDAPYCQTKEALTRHEELHMRGWSHRVLDW